MQIALDEGPGPPIKYQYPELGKLYSVVSHLVRCFDVTERCQSSSSVSPISSLAFRLIYYQSLILTDLRNSTGVYLVKM